MNGLPKDKNGNVLHNQPQAHNHCLRKLKNDNIDWCAVIDMDEYIMLNKYNTICELISSLKSNIANLKIGQYRFDSRFNNIGKQITNITNAEVNDLNRSHSNKNIFNVKFTSKICVHNWVSNSMSKIQIMPPLNLIWFNHYKLNSSKYKTIDNVNKQIKEKIKENRKSYISLDKYIS